MFHRARPWIGIAQLAALSIAGPSFAQMAHHHGPAPAGMYGPYPATREASGTAWQPDLARHRGIHTMRGPWMLMLHGGGDLVFDHQGGKRGLDEVFSGNMVMGMAQRGL